MGPRDRDGDERGASDAALVAAVARGDGGAFATLYDEYSPIVYGLAVRMTGDAQAAEDLAQEVFLSLWRRAGAYDPRRGAVRTWILAMTHHSAVDALRARAAAGRRADALAARSGTVEPPDEVPERVLAAEEARRVLAALETLPAEQRETLELAYLHDRSQAEIAERTGVPLGTVKSRVRLGLARLRVALAPEAA